MRLVIYVRVSSNQQLVEGQGLDIQEEDCRRWLRKHRHRLVEVCTDGARSGADDVADRPGLIRALALVGADQADGIVVQCLDRLARDMLVQEQLLAELNRRGKELHSTSPVEDYNLEHTPEDPARALVRRMFGAIGQYEREKIRMRLRAGIARKALAGGYIGGPPPYGYSAVRGKLVPIPAEQAGLKLMRRMRRDGASYRQIVAELDRREVPCRKGGSWQPGTIQYILKREEGRKGTRKNGVYHSPELLEATA